MLNSLFIAATGMQAGQSEIDTVANNLVNLNTMGFKKSRVAFETLMPQPTTALPRPGASSLSYQGMGVSGTQSMLDFTAGDLSQTQGALDFAIQGEGLFELQMPDGSLAYTRNGQLHIDNDGNLVSTDGYPLSAQIQVPSDYVKLVVTSDGQVQIQKQGSEALTNIGTIQLSHFANAAGLKPTGNNLYVAADGAGEVVYSHPGENGAGTLMQGYLETSNVQMVDEMTNMMTAQRAYEANSRVLQASDEILGIINNLRK